MIFKSIRIVITKNAVKNLKDNRVNGEATFSAFFENKKLKPNITDVVVPGNIR